MKKFDLLREVIRSIMVEEFSDKEEFDFSVRDPADHEYIISAIYHRVSPFRMELWKAVDTETGEEFDPEELEEFIPDLQDRAFEVIAQKYR